MHNGGRLGNQIWLIAAVYAYCLESNTVFDIRCFFEYQEYFDIRMESKLAWLYGKKYYFWTNFLMIPEDIARDIFYTVFNLWCDIFILIKKKRVIFEINQTNPNIIKLSLYRLYTAIFRIIKEIYARLLHNNIASLPSYGMTSTSSILLLSTSNIPANSYLYGWLFRNPAGIIKYQDEVRSFITPRLAITKKIDVEIANARSNFSRIVGVHIRLGDVVNEYINNNRVAFSEPEVYKILKEYLTFAQLKCEDVCFLICSDGKISDKAFPGLNFKIHHGNPVEDLWFLSKTDIIIGADSSFAISASYLGDKPFIVFKRDRIDWD